MPTAQPYNSEELEVEEVIVDEDDHNSSHGRIVSQSQADPLLTMASDHEDGDDASGGNDLNGQSENANNDDPKQRSIEKSEDDGADEDDAPVDITDTPDNTTFDHAAQHSFANNIANKNNDTKESTTAPTDELEKPPPQMNVFAALSRISNLNTIRNQQQIIVSNQHQTEATKKQTGYEPLPSHSRPAKQVTRKQTLPLRWTENNAHRNNNDNNQNKEGIVYPKVVQDVEFAESAVIMSTKQTKGASTSRVREGVGKTNNRSRISNAERESNHVTNAKQSALANMYANCDDEGDSSDNYTPQRKTRFKKKNMGGDGGDDFDPDDDGDGSDDDDDDDEGYESEGEQHISDSAVRKHRKRKSTGKKTQTGAAKRTKRSTTQNIDKLWWNDNKWWTEYNDDEAINTSCNEVFAKLFPNTYILPTLSRTLAVEALKKIPTSIQQSGYDKVQDWVKNDGYSNVSRELYDYLTRMLSMFAVMENPIPWKSFFGDSFDLLLNSADPRKRGKKKRKSVQQDNSPGLSDDEGIPWNEVITLTDEQGNVIRKGLKDRNKSRNTFVCNNLRFKLASSGERSSECIYVGYYVFNEVSNKWSMICGEDNLRTKRHDGSQFSKPSKHWSENDLLGGTRDQPKYHYYTNFPQMPSVLKQRCEKRNKPFKPYPLEAAVTSISSSKYGQQCFQCNNESISKDLLDALKENRSRSGSGIPCGATLKGNDLVYLDGRDSVLVGSLYYIGVFRMVFGKRTGCKVGMVKCLVDDFSLFANRFGVVKRINHDKRGGIENMSQCTHFVDYRPMKYQHSEFVKRCHGIALVDLLPMDSNGLVLDEGKKGVMTALEKEQMDKELY